MRKWTVVATAILLVESGIAFAQVTFPEGQSKLPEQMERVRQQIQQLGSEPASADLQREIQGTTLQLMSLARGGRGAAPLRSATPAPYTCDPVNPNATPEARTLLKSLCSVSGKGILTGQHNFPNERDVDSNRIFEVTGKYPAIWGSDFGFTSGEDKDAITHRDLMIAEAKKQAAAGSIIYLCWHMLRPTEDEPGQPGASWSGSVQAKLSDEQWQELIAADSPLHQRWEKYIDTAAAYLKQLQDAHIAVLWRPMHENNGTFFWWGGRPGPYGTAMLYREVYNRMVNVHHLNNLVWVWNQNGPAPGGEFYNYFPGRNYCDVVSYDNYRTLDDRYYQEILTIADGKPIALGEVGSIPSPEILKAQPKWTFFMTWGGMSGAPQPTPVLSPEAIQAQRRSLTQQMEELQRQLQKLGSATPSPELLQQAQRLAMQLGPLSGRGRGPDPESARQTLREAYGNPYLLKRGDPLPK